MAPTYLDPGGLVIPESALAHRRARELAMCLRLRDDVFAQLVDCRRNAGVETVVFDAEVQRPQVLTNDILGVERIAARFTAEDQDYPEVLALRADFPLVLHLNQRLEEFPRSLCLYDRPWTEIRVTWTAPAFLERARWWLAGTADGSLHQDDQALEPLLLSCGLWLVLPPEAERSGATSWSVELVGGERGRVFLARATPRGNRGGLPHLVLMSKSPPRCHGTSPKLPTTLEDLIGLVGMARYDLLTDLRETLRNWPKEREAELNARVIVVVELPKTRTEGGPIEAVDRKAFLTTRTGLELGSDVGVWEIRDGKRGLLLPINNQARGQTTKILVVNVLDPLTRAAAAHYNGQSGADDVNILAVGAGALGSQIAMNLARAGFGRWTVVDSDFVLPHNLARHYLDGRAVGFPKAEALAFELNSLSTPAAAIVADVIKPGEAAETLQPALRDAGLVLDLSASVAVSRCLAKGSGEGRRMSAFLSPSGRDLVLMCEDRTRELRLDHLEMQYYAAVATDQRLAGHLADPEGWARYGLSCRDVTSRISQTCVGAFAGVAAEAIRRASRREPHLMRVWRSDEETMAVGVCDIAPERLHEQRQGDWSLRVAPSLLTAVADWRQERLPNETGGVLLGGVDYDQRTMYVLLALPSPPDSEEWPTLYIRGCEGLRRAVEGILERTLGHIVYLGEWHSHPTGVRTMPSSDDLKVLSSVGDRVAPAGYPGIMLIAGDGGRARAFLGQFDPRHPPDEMSSARV